MTWPITLYHSILEVSCDGNCTKSLRTLFQWLIYDLSHCKKKKIKKRLKTKPILMDHLPVALWLLHLAPCEDRSLTHLQVTTVIASRSTLKVNLLWSSRKYLSKLPFFFFSFCCLKIVVSNVFIIQHSNVLFFVFFSISNICLMSYINK